MQNVKLMAKYPYCHTPRFMHIVEIRYENFECGDQSTFLVHSIRFIYVETLIHIFVYFRGMRCYFVEQFESTNEQ
jgi:hypothetical protein